MRQMTILLLAFIIALCPVTLAVGADDVFDEGYDYWDFGHQHLGASATVTLDPGFTPSFFWIDADSLDIHIQCTAVGDSTFASVADVMAINDGEGIQLPLRVDKVKVTSQGDAGHIRWVFAGHSE
jgi:hypothetical protein